MPLFLGEADLLVLLSTPRGGCTPGKHLDSPPSQVQTSLLLASSLCSHLDFLEPTPHSPSLPDTSHRALFLCTPTPAALTDYPLLSFTGDVAGAWELAWQKGCCQRAGDKVKRPGRSVRTRTLFQLVGQAHTTSVVTSKTPSRASRQGQGPGERYHVRIFVGALLFHGPREGRVFGRQNARAASNFSTPSLQLVRAPAPIYLSKRRSLQLPKPPSAVAVCIPARPTRRATRMS